MLDIFESYGGSGAAVYRFPSSRSELVDFALLNTFWMLDVEHDAAILVFCTVDIHESETIRYKEADTVESLVHGLSVTEAGDKRPKKYCRMLSMTLKEMAALVTSCPTEFEKQLMGITEEDNIQKERRGNDVRLEKGEHVQYSVTRRKRGRTGLDMNELLDEEDPLKRMGLFRICDIECKFSGDIDKENDDDAKTEDVFDLYIQKDSHDDDSDVLEEHQIIYVRDEDFFVPDECFDAEDSFEDTEDSNAEGYYGNDYPDDEDVWDDSSGESLVDNDEMAFVDLDRHLEQKFGGFYDSSEDGISSSDVDY